MIQKSLSLPDCIRTLTIVFVFSLALSAFSQSFTIVGDSVTTLGTTPSIAKMINKTADTLRIDTVFFKFLPQPINNQPRPLDSIIIWFKAGNKNFGFGHFLMKPDSLYYYSDYGKAEGNLISLQPHDSIQLTNFYGTGLLGGSHPGKLFPSDTNRFALIIFQSGTIRDTLILMGILLEQMERAQSQMYIPFHSLMLNKYSSQETYNILGRRLSPALVLPKQLRLIVDKNGNAVPWIVGR